MAKLSSVDKKRFEELLIDNGYVLDYSNSTFTSLFKSAVDIDIYSEKYEGYGDSKGNRLRAFWDTESDDIVGLVLSELLEMWLHINKNPENLSYIACLKTIDRLKNTKKEEGKFEESFLNQKFEQISYEKLPISSELIPIIKSRLYEASKCFDNKSFLAAIFLTGSILEAILLGYASKNNKKFLNLARAPKTKDNKPIPINRWTLSQLIDTSCSLHVLGEDIRKFSHGLRDFRNYIHPYKQLQSGFNPDYHTAKIAMQVLRATVANLTGER